MFSSSSAETGPNLSQILNSGDVELSNLVQPLRKTVTFANTQDHELDRIIFNQNGNDSDTDFRNSLNVSQLGSRIVDGSNPILTIPTLHGEWSLQNGAYHQNTTRTRIADKTSDSNSSRYKYITNPENAELHTRNEYRNKLVEWKHIISNHESILKKERKKTGIPRYVSKIQKSPFGYLTRTFDFADKHLDNFLDKRTEYDDIENTEFSESDLQLSKTELENTMNYLYSNSMTSVVTNTSKMVQQFQNSQRDLYGNNDNYTKITNELWDKTMTEALKKHFDDTLDNHISKMSSKLPIDEDDKHRLRKQREKLKDIDNGLQNGKITVQGVKDSIRCTWRSESTVPEGIPGIKKPKVRKPDDTKRIIAETCWTWKDGDVKFDGNVESDDDVDSTGEI
ncbi:uncharacterized protein L201_006720 [Kwoniella dendrophila CBS 6074]|uniref:Uncharacterized protein n=1 Tax=Kwoniella dendrophila CBS 6074 TaxID=1295534 RepID=A0AAX4K3V9_9TREE